MGQVPEDHILSMDALLLVPAQRFQALARSRALATGSRICDSPRLAYAQVPDNC
jgi:hypothetical protein